MRGKRSHKGKTRSFTAPDEIDRQVGRAAELKIEEEGDDEVLVSSTSKTVNAEDTTDSSDDEVRYKGVSHLIDVCNPNLEDVGAKELPSRKEAEAATRAVADPLTLKSEVELASDLARLALVRKEREQAALKREQEKQARETAREAAAARAQAKLQSLRQKGSSKTKQKRGAAGGVSNEGPADCEQNATVTGSAES